MNCPYCSNEMQQGYVQCRDDVAWTPKRQPVAAFSNWGKGAIELGNDDDCIRPSSSAIAYNCPSCKVVIIPYKE